MDAARDRIEAEAAGAPSEGLDYTEADVQRMADALHEDCRLEWQAVAVVDPGRLITQHMADAHYGQAHDLVRRLRAAAPSVAPSESERAALFEAGRATGTVEGWADYTNAPGETADE